MLYIRALPALIAHHPALAYGASFLITLARDTGEYGRPLEALKQMLHEGFAVKSVSRSGDKIQIDHENHRYHWGGKVMLIGEGVA